jgi:hypothetical protein
MYLLLQIMSSIIHRGLLFSSFTAFSEVTCILEPDQIHTLGLVIARIHDFYEALTQTQKH